MNSIKNTARLAGVLYLLMVPLGAFGMSADTFVVAGDAAATANKIMDSEGMFRLGIVSALTVQIVNILLVLVLYRVLKPVNTTLVRLMMIFILLGAPIAMLNELNRFAILLLLSGSDYLAQFPVDQLQAQVLLLFDLHDYGIAIAGIFWGLWLFPMGYLVFKSGYLPKVLGILLMIGCCGYLVDSFALFLFPDSNVEIAIFTFWGEVFFPLWLLIKGVNVEQWEKRALEAT